MEVKSRIVDTCILVLWSKIWSLHEDRVVQLQEPRQNYGYLYPRPLEWDLKPPWGQSRAAPGTSSAHCQRPAPTDWHKAIIAIKFFLIICFYTLDEPFIAIPPDHFLFIFSFQEALVLRPWLWTYITLHYYYPSSTVVSTVYSA